jgi:hypothetical protein
MPITYIIDAMVREIGAAVLLGLGGAPALGQTPQPIPLAGHAVVLTQAGAAGVTPGQGAASEVPTIASLGFPNYPAAEFLGSYDAGAFGQRYYLFGTTAPFDDIVTFYRAMLGTRGNLVFREPPTHMFEVGRFRDDAMVFPPGITVKDWTWNSRGYPNPRFGAQPERFPTILMVVPPPPQ